MQRGASKRSSRSAKRRVASTRPVRAAKSKKPGWRTAATSDPQELYELSVQDPDAEMDFIDRVWTERRGRLARTLREDFCGSAIASCAWVKRRRENRAWGVDVNPAVLAWAAARLPGRLTPAQRRRLVLVQGDVLTARTPRVESIVAMNFSSFIFKTRPAMLRYLRTVHANLARGGIFFMDAYGGSESFEEMEEERDLDGFTYVWDQHLYNPVTGEVINRIHFRFPDGTEIRSAFEYDWRLWTLPELREMLEEAGFRHVTVYWEGTDPETNEGDGVFTPTMRGEACPGWIAYLVGEK